MATQLMEAHPRYAPNVILVVKLAMIVGQWETNISATLVPILLTISFQGPTPACSNALPVITLQQLWLVIIYAVPATFLALSVVALPLVVLNAMQVAPLIYYIMVAVSLNALLEPLK